jgi:hypothetical protein
MRRASLDEGMGEPRKMTEPLSINIKTKRIDTQSVDQPQMQTPTKKSRDAHMNVMERQDNYLDESDGTSDEEMDDELSDEETAAEKKAQEEEV